MSTHPQADRLREVQAQTQAAGEFVRWLAEVKGIRLISLQLEPLLAEWKGIDLNALDREQRAMLDELRAARTFDPEIDEREPTGADHDPNAW
jgi:hypothetical protein